MNKEEELIEITDKLKPAWKEYVNKYEKAVRREVRKKLGFWKYYFTNEGIVGEFIMLNTSFKNYLKEKP